MRKLLQSDTDYLNLSIEQMATQFNDKSIQKLESHFSHLSDISEHYTSKLSSGLSYFTFKQTKPIITQMEKLISDRFKFNIKLVHMDNTPAAVLPTPPIKDNVINEHAEELYEYTKDKLNLKDCKDKDCTHIKRPIKVKEYQDIHSVNKDENSIYYHVYNSFNNIQKTLRTDTVNVNLKKATIENLPKDYVIFIFTDFHLMFNTYKVTPQEYIAIILHEIGHAFTHISQSYRSVHNTSVLLNTIHNGLSQDKAYTPTLKLTYKQLGGKEDISDDSALTITLKTIDLYMDMTKELDMYNPHSYTDSEQLADNFATRFGYGSHLVSGLDKLTYSNHNVINFILVVSIQTFIVALLIFANVTVAFTMAIMAPIRGVIEIMIRTRILDLAIPERYRKETYDRVYKRYDRVKLDVIRQLRTSDLPRDIISKYIKDYEYIDKIMEDTPKEKRFSEVLASIIPWNSGSVRRKLAEQTFEKMIENKLHVSKHKLEEHL